ncbi:MAG: hypothetical protein U0872_14485 [Planctomycetaceae bacterium]
MFALIFSLFWYGISCGGVIAREERVHAPRVQPFRRSWNSLFLVPFLAAEADANRAGRGGGSRYVDLAIDHEKGHGARSCRSARKELADEDGRHHRGAGD